MFFCADGGRGSDALSLAEPLKAGKDSSDPVSDSKPGGKSGASSSAAKATSAAASLATDSAKDPTAKPGKKTGKAASKLPEGADSDAEPEEEAASEMGKEKHGAEESGADDPVGVVAGGLRGNAAGSGAKPASEAVKPAAEAAKVISGEEELGELEYEDGEARDEDQAETRAGRDSAAAPKAEAVPKKPASVAAGKGAGAGTGLPGAGAAAGKGADGAADLGGKTAASGAASWVSAGKGAHADSALEEAQLELEKLEEASGGVGTKGVGAAGKKVGAGAAAGKREPAGDSKVVIKGLVKPTSGFESDDGTSADATGKGDVAELRPKSEIRDRTVGAEEDVPDADNAAGADAEAAGGAVVAASGGKASSTGVQTKPLALAATALHAAGAAAAAAKARKEPGGAGTKTAAGNVATGAESDPDEVLAEAALEDDEEAADGGLAVEAEADADEPLPGMPKPSGTAAAGSLAAGKSGGGKSSVSADPDADEENFVSDRGLGGSGKAAASALVKGTGTGSQAGGQAGGAKKSASAASALEAAAAAKADYADEAGDDAGERPAQAGQGSAPKLEEEGVGSGDGKGSLPESGAGSDGDVAEDLELANVEIEAAGKDEWWRSGSQGASTGTKASLRKGFGKGSKLGQYVSRKKTAQYVTRFFLHLFLSRLVLWLTRHISVVRR